MRVDRFGIGAQDRGRRSCTKAFQQYVEPYGREYSGRTGVITNVRIRDVEEAQQRIVDVIRALEAQGQIIIVKGGKDDIIA